jgi:type III secretion protein J
LRTLALGIRLLAPLLVAASLTVLTACEGELDIVHGLTELEANEILVVLETQGISAKKTMEEGRVVTWAVVVPGSRSKDALGILVANRLPKPRSSGLAQVYPAGSGGLIPTKSEEKAKFLLAMQGEVESMLKSLPGVQETRVSIVVPERDVIRDIDTKPPPATASVAVVYNPDKDKKPPVTKEEIQQLVAAAVEGLLPENVTVVMKENAPAPLVGAAAGARPMAPIAGETVMSVRVVDKKAGLRAKLIIFSAFGLAGLGVLMGIIGIARFAMVKGKLSKAEAEVASLKKARREG